MVESAGRNGKDSKQIVEVDTVAIRFAGDSGDGMQLAGDRFTNATALAGNDLSTFPDYPAEIRAPAGTLAGVSGFQINFSNKEVHTPGDEVDVLVAMNPAALKANLGDLKKGGVIIANVDNFGDKNLEKAGYTSSPLQDEAIRGAYKIHEVAITSMTRRALEDMELQSNLADRCKNFFAIGLMSWMYSRPVEPTKKWIHDKFGKRPDVLNANLRAFDAGYFFGETAEIFEHHYVVREATYAPGTYRNISGNVALAYGFIAAAKKMGLPLFWGAYPITPASDVLHELSRHKKFGVLTFQAEDEIAAMSATVGASYTGALAVTCSSGPGIALKGEAIGLGVMAELPMVICNVQRGGPSTGLPTKTEQADLLQAVCGRNGECPVPVLAACTPSDCFWTAIEASRLAVKYMTPVLLLSDGYLANGTEPWKLPRAADIPEMPVRFLTNPEDFKPYLRDKATLARPWVVPGTPKMQHRVGGLEKADITGNVSYDPQNHEHMVRTRAAKVAGIVKDIPPVQVIGKESGKVLVVGWGGTFGAITAAIEALQARGASVSQVHLRHLNPFPPNLGEVLKKFDKVLVPELNLGQLSKLIRAEFLVDAVGLNKVQGRPFMVSEIISKVEELL
ncbi:MAG: 2-oxoacid:acceptor oxidoreductase subunit alpha [Candidatus Tectomicrobia bacterium]|uniref:2-oxoacid:acceptor oxidoreductase subunit alpha n=1 Tax=Tectimicrobiota bacterium TaxID=2528274 RepID=A0A932I1W4_UNCTE|nr:2-oxoacid:acceptor oxidoreductase subunit alpha [Candidatus Tectomicrobia bacterium]